MGWLLAGCCGLALIHLSASLLQVTQKPRFYGVKTNSNVIMRCCSNQLVAATVRWYKSETGDADPERSAEVTGKHFGRRQRNQTQVAVLSIRKVQVQDAGVYFCRMNGSWGPGTQLIVVKAIDLAKVQHRSAMKDGLIVFQGLLLAVCIGAMLLRTQTLTKNKNDSIYEQPETEHIYEGLAIDTCGGGGLYEELSVYAEADAAEAPWE